MYENIERRTKTQTKPSSSAITENIKSHCTSGRYQYFCIDFPNHNQVNPPLPIAMSACSD